MKRIKGWINVAITALLTCTILITMLSAFVRFTLTDKQIYLKLLDNTNTYAAVTDTLYGKMSNILGSDVSEDLKKSIITEEDVRKEADVVLDCMINNLINGQTMEPYIDTDIYKERIAEALKSLTGYDAYINNRKNLTSSNIIGGYTIQPMNLITKSDSESKSTYLKADNYKIINDDLFFENLATRAELEAQGRAMLREKGMTEAQARAKLAEKGISEEQVWQYLRDNGYLDSEESGSGEGLHSSTGTNKVPDAGADSESKAEIESETEIIREESSQEINTQSKDTDDDKISKNKIQNIVMSVVLDQNMSFEEKMDKIYSELMNEAEIIINKEIDSLNISKLINSNMFKVAVKATSILYKSFYIDLVFIAVLILILGAINSFNFKKMFNCLAKSMLISGILSAGIFGFIYVSKIYMNFSGIFSKSYLQTMFIYSAEHFCRIILIASVVIFIAGLIMNIFIIKNRLSRR
ncbi:MAG: hypothetical protein Q4F66_11900 [Clostridium sp.]|nr:hypothetical protein [Clostridium sp.]